VRSIAGSVLYGCDHDVLIWVAERVPGFRVTDDDRALAVVHDGKIAAAVAYSEYNGVHVTVAIAAEGRRWATRDALLRLFGYPFCALNCEAISVLVASTNVQSLNLATKLGFKVEALIKFAAHDGSALIVLKMLKSECRWIENGQKRGQRTEGAERIRDSLDRSAVQPA